MNSKIKVAVIGSCVTRDIFNSNFISNYKEIYECVSTAWQTSIISFMSDRTWFPDDQKGFVEEVTKHQRNTTNRDIAKRYRDEFIEAQPDYIIVDLYTDVKYGVVKTDAGYLTNNPNGFRKTLYYKNENHQETLNIFKDERYLPLFYGNFHRFVDWVKTNIPNCKIVMNGFWETYSYFTEGSYVKNYSPKICSTVAKDNAMYDQMYEKLRTEYNVEFLEMRNKTYYGDYKHVYGNKPWHFTQEYYYDLYSSLNEVVFKSKYFI